MHQELPQSNNAYVLKLLALPITLTGTTIRHAPLLQQNLCTEPRGGASRHAVGVGVVELSSVFAGFGWIEWRAVKCAFEHVLHLASVLQRLAGWPASPHRKHAPALLHAARLAASSMFMNASHASTPWFPRHAMHLTSPPSTFFGAGVFAAVGFASAAATFTGFDDPDWLELDDKA